MEGAIRLWGNQIHTAGYFRVSFHWYGGHASRFESAWDFGYFGESKYAFENAIWRSKLYSYLGGTRNLLFLLWLFTPKWGDSSVDLTTKHRKYGHFHSSVLSNLDPHFHSISPSVLHLRYLRTGHQYFGIQSFHPTWNHSSWDKFPHNLHQC